MSSLIIISSLAHHLPTVAMKRTLENSEIPTINTLPTEVLQKILVACPNKEDIRLVCNQWTHLTSFKKWGYFIKTQDIFRTMHLSAMCCFKLYADVCREKDVEPQKEFLLKTILYGRKDILKKTTLTQDTLDTICYRWLIDNPTEHNLKELDQALNDTHAKELIQDYLATCSKKLNNLDPQVSALLQKNMISDATIRGQILPGVVPTNPSLIKLHEILLSQDTQALKEYISHENTIKTFLDNKTSFQASCPNSMLTYANLESAEILIEFIQEHRPLNTFNYWGGPDSPYIDWLLYRLFSREQQRLDIAEILLQHGAQQRTFIHGEQPSVLKKIMETQNIPALQLLLKHKWQLPLDFKIEVLKGNEAEIEDDEEAFLLISPLVYMIAYKENLNPLFLEHFVQGFSHSFLEPMPDLKGHTVLSLVQLCYSSEIADTLLKAYYCPQSKISDNHHVLIHNQNNSIKADTGSVCDAQDYTRYPISPLYAAMLAQDYQQVDHILAHDSSALFEYNSYHPMLKDPITFAYALGDSILYSKLQMRQTDQLYSSSHIIRLNTDAEIPIISNAPGSRAYTVTPLAYAICTGKEWLVERLLEISIHAAYTKADLALALVGINTLFDLAQHCGNPKIIAMLENVRHSPPPTPMSSNSTNNT